MWQWIKRAGFSALRIWLGFQWINAGLHKVGEAAWTGSNAGAAVAGFARGAIAKSVGDNPSVQTWFANFLESFVVPNSGVFGYMVAYGEVFVGLGLILGAFTGFAALAGALMNLNFMLAGTTSTNPILYTAALLIIAEVAAAQYFGLDTFLRPRVENVAKTGVERIKARFARLEA